MVVASLGHREIIPAPAGSGLAGRALLGWMHQEQAVKFLTQDCLFSAPLTPGAAEEIWESHKEVVESLPPMESPAAGKLEMSAADLKAARKFRNKYPAAAGIVDFIRVNPMDLVVHQLWISTDISGRYRDSVTPDRWLNTALLDPPSNPRLTSRSAGDDITFDLPHAEFFLTVPAQPNEIRVSEGDGFVTVALHAGRALLLRGYHRTFACAQFIREAVNAPHGVLFAVSSQLASIGSLADEVHGMMAGPRPPRMADFFDDRFSLPVTLRKRRYQMRIHCEVVETDWEEEDQIPAGKSTLAVTPAFDRPDSPARSTDAPRDFQAIFDEAWRQQTAKRLDAAVALYERALFLRPDSVDAHNNLGVAVMAQTRIEDAIVHYERALALDPNHVAANTNLGIALGTLGKVDQAVAYYQRALAIDPLYPHAHVELGNALKFQGKFDEAMAEYDRAIAIEPDYADAHFIRGELKTFHPGDADLSLLEALAVRGDLAPDQQSTIHFALYKALEDCGDYERAFEHLRKGNELKRRLIEYNEAKNREFFRRVATVFDRGLLDRFEGAGDPSSLPIFVVGMPRSGSSLVEQILASHPQIHGAGELMDLDVAARLILRANLSASGPQVPYPESFPSLSDDALRRMGQTYLARLPAVAEGKTRIVDKMPGNYVRIGIIRTILPNARIIHTMRDPIDNCVSCYSKSFAVGHQFSFDQAELARYYRMYAEMMSHWRSVLPPGVMLDVSYEEVVDDLEGQARRLIEYCGLPWDDRCLSFHKTKGTVRTASAAQVRQPLFRTSLQRWRKYEAGLGVLLRELGDLVPVETESGGTTTVS